MFDDDLRTLLDADTASDSRPGATIAPSPTIGFAATPRIPVQVAVDRPIFPDVLVDSLVADPYTRLLQQPAGYQLRAPVQAKQALDSIHEFRGHLACLGGEAAPLIACCLGDRGDIASIHAVVAQLTRDGGGTDSNQARDSTVGFACFPHGVDLIALALGQNEVLHL